MYSHMGTQHMQLATHMLPQGVCRSDDLCLLGCFNGKARGDVHQKQQLHGGTPGILLLLQQRG
jgi:hypothetical protein